METHLRRQKLKAEDMAVVKEWRKNQKRGSNNTEFPEELLDPKNKKRKELLESSGPLQVKGLTKSKKRQAKDNKYGRGGAKRFKRDNDSESASDMSGFSKKRNQAGVGVRPKGFAPRKEQQSFKQKPKGPTRRPGKTARRAGK